MSDLRAWGGEVKRLLKNLLVGVPRLRCLSLLILALATGCQADGPELVTTSSGEVYLLKDGVLFHVQGDEATRVQGDAPFDPPPSEILKEFTDTIYTSSTRIRTDLKLKYFGPSNVRYRLTLTSRDTDVDTQVIIEETANCWRKASPFLEIFLEDVDGFRMGTVRLNAFSDIESSLQITTLIPLFFFDRRLQVSDSVIETSSISRDAEFLAARGQLRLSAAEFKKIVQSSAVGPICP